VTPTIRFAEEKDCPRIAEITNDAIVNGVAHFATTPDDPASVAAAWRRDHTVYPWFVAVDGPGGRVVGFSRAAQWKTRQAYDWTCESAVYVDRSARARGLGLALYRALFEELGRRGFRCVIAGVTVPNPASERLHERLGMTAAGTFASVGFKHGAWRDVRYYTKTLGDGSAPAGPPGGGGGEGDR
jgi:phosphinothricin acetyltransferase